MGRSFLSLRTRHFGQRQPNSRFYFPCFALKHRLLAGSIVLIAGCARSMPRRHSSRNIFDYVFYLLSKLFEPYFKGLIAAEFCKHGFSAKLGDRPAGGRGRGLAVYDSLHHAAA